MVVHLVFTRPGHHHPMTGPGHDEGIPAIIEGGAMRRSFHEHLEELRATVIRLGALTTERRHVEALWDLMQQETKRA